MRLQVLVVAASLFCVPMVVAAQRGRLLPEPQSVEYGLGSVPVQGLVIGFASTPSVEDRFAANELARDLEKETGMRLALVEGATSARAIILKRIGPVDALPAPGEEPGPDSREAYRLSIGRRGIEITGRSSAAVFYGVQTLLQLARGRGAAATFPDVTIRDWPSLAYRATLVDVGSEGPMSTVKQIENQLDLLARYKGNQYFFYSEANIQLNGFPLLNPEARFTTEQVRQIIAYARERHIDVVPAVELFGHLHDLFRIERYSGLADFPHGGEFNPANPEVKRLLADWTARIAELFPSPFVDIGFDETFSIEKAAANEGAGATPVRLFLEQLRTVTELFQARRKHVMAYADIMVKFPGIISQLPPGLIALPWYYDPQPDPQYRHWLMPLVEHHVPHLVVSGVSSWSEIAPDFDTTFANIDTLLLAGRKSHALGLVNTVWTDDGQMLMRTSWPGMAYGAVAAWQSQPVDRAGFFAAYSREVYPPAVAGDVAQAIIESNAAEQNLQAVFGAQTMAAVWKDPFAPEMLRRVRPRREDLHECRLHAENAEEDLYRALGTTADPEALKTLLVEAQLLDYAGMKYLYALEIADAWATLGTNPKKEQLAETLHEGISSSVHSRTADLMDAIGQLRADYRRQWLAEYTDYRLPTALSRWSAELEYWRRMQARFGDLLTNFHDSESLPSLEKVAGTSVVQ
jgi:hexosaminidase